MLIAAVVVAVLGLQVATEECGGEERWPVKTVADSEKGDVVLTPKATTIKKLRALKAPDYHDDNLRAATEKKTWSITGIMKGDIFEDDQDYHLVIADDDGNTVIVELPDPACATGSRVKKQITKARKQFLKSFQTPKSKFTAYVTHPLTVHITGVGFFDKKHGQKGLAPNGIELHPVLSIEVVP